MDNHTSGFVDPKSGGIYWSKLCLIVIPAMTILGNILVIMSVLKFKPLQTAINFLIFGLAFADLFVAIFVMPYAVYVEVSGGFWYLGDLMCNIYTSCDVACSTASILILAVISFDRYRAVSKPVAYSRQTQNIAQVFYMLGAIWLISIALASPIVLGANSRPPTESAHECRLYNAHFIIISSIISFVIPCFVVLFVYLRIIQELRKREQAARLRHCAHTNQISHSTNTTACESTNSGEEPSLLNTETGYLVVNKDYGAASDEMALCIPSASHSYSGDIKGLPSKKPFNFFSTLVPNRAVGRHIRSYFANSEFSLPLRKQKRFSAATGGQSINTLAQPAGNDENCEMSPSTLDSETQSRSTSNGSNFENSNVCNTCPCSQALFYGMTVHRVRPNSDESTLSTIVVPHSQFYRFCRALAKKPARKQNEEDGNQTSNDSTITSLQNCLSHGNGREKSDAFLQVAAPMVTFNVMVHEMPSNGQTPHKSSLNNRRQSNAAKTCLQRSKTCGSFENCLSENRLDCHDKTGLQVQPSLQLIPKKSDASSISTFLKGRITKRSMSSKRTASKRKLSKMQRKERRATKTLGVVVGVFLLCWLPFFSMHILNAICIIIKLDTCQVNFDLFFYSTWLGYMNSFMNPIIYTVFNGEFRRAFKAILHLDSSKKLQTLRR